MAIYNKYKDTLNNLIDSSDSESLDWPEPIDKGSCNTPRFVGSSMKLLEGGCLDKNFLDCQSIWQAPKTGDF